MVTEVISDSQYPLLQIENRAPATGIRQRTLLVTNITKTGRGVSLLKHF